MPISERISCSCLLGTLACAHLYTSRPHRHTFVPALSCSYAVQMHMHTRTSCIRFALNYPSACPYLFFVFFGKMHFPTYVYDLKLTCFLLGKLLKNSSTFQQRQNRVCLKICWLSKLIKLDLFDSVFVFMTFFKSSTRRTLGLGRSST